MRYLPIPAVKLPKGINVHGYSIGGSRSVAVRVITPIEKGVPRPAILWLHGGGFVMGSAKQDDRTCARLADLLQAVVISVDYRLAPEHPYPAALEDCYAAYEYLHRAATSLHIDSSRIAVVGQSAGGGLAASLIQMIRDRGDPMPALQMLSYPMLDDKTVLKPVNDALHRLWDSSSNRFGWACYLAMAPGGVDVPDYAVPMRLKDLSKLAPAWIGVGTHDLFYDEDVKYAQRLEQAGVEVHLEIIEGAFHGFDLAAPNALISKRFFELQVAALAQAFRKF
ncbi:alpha/beta hydrolase [Pseudomonas gingeri]|uniref:alpha/beta hydrolase n=1 Tax=Pseudomonas gingeri TaxID=117681 RepID=UPI001C435E12|nr:alpha/beta hydrolase [Pseudomonas gingeri]